jgi:hypothetical protein
VVWVSLVQFFDLISFFALASLFAWLGYAPLQRQLIDGIEESKRPKARENLVTITDYFLNSFFFYCTAAVADYFAHNFLVEYNILLLPVVGATFLFGTVTLLVSMLYIRKGLGNINPPPFFLTVLVTWITATNTGLSAALITSSSPSLPAKTLFTILVGVSCYFSIRELRNWDSITFRSSIFYLMMMMVSFVALIFLYAVSHVFGTSLL